MSDGFRSLTAINEESTSQDPNDIELSIPQDTPSQPSSITKITPPQLYDVADHVKPQDEKTLQPQTKIEELYAESDVVSAPSRPSVDNEGDITESSEEQLYSKRQADTPQSELDHFSSTRRLIVDGQDLDLPPSLRK